MRIIFLGPPGSGKGTQAQLISKKYNITNISTGMLLRHAFQITPQSLLNTNNTKKIMNSGNLIDDKFMTKLIFMRINQSDCSNGFLLDGFPRTINQVLFMEKYKILVEYVIQFTISDDEIINRITGRRVHLTSGRTYHINFNPPKSFNLDDITGETLITREDDYKHVVQNRLRRYYQYTQPVLEYYKNKYKNKQVNYLTINGTQTIKEIYKELVNFIDLKKTNF